MRAIAMIGVICIHASAWGPTAPFGSVDLISRFSVPAFMTLTGTLLAYRYSGRPLGLAFMQRRLARSVLPWLVWAPVYIVFNFLIGVLPVRGASVLSFVEYGAGHLWFLLLIPQFYVLFAIWPRHNPWLVAAVAMLVQTLLCVVRIYTVLPGWQSQVTLAFGVLIFPFWIGYFAVGVAAGRSLAARIDRGVAVPRAASPLWIIAGAIAVAASGYMLLNVHYPGSPYAAYFLKGTGAFLNPVLPVFVFCVVCWLFACAPLLMRAWRPFGRAIAVLSEQSLGLYIVHPILLWFFGRMLQRGVQAMGALSALSFGVFVLATLVVTSLVVRVISATPLAMTIGTPRQPLRIPWRPRRSGRAAQAT